MRFPGRPRELGCCQRGGNVGGEGVQFRVGREHLADPQIKLVFGQPSLHERGLERVEHLLAVGLRRYQAAAVGPRLLLTVRHPQIFCSVDQCRPSGRCAGIRTQVNVLLDVRPGCHSPVPSGQFVRKL
jgi:hypothetical protein